MDQPDSAPDFNQNTQTSGPQFELAESGGWGKKCREWINRYGSSVILPIIALIILASGIYLYATQKRQENNAILSQEEVPTTVVTTDTATATEQSIKSPAAIEDNTDKKIIENLAINNTPETEKIKEILPEKKQTGNIITIKAEKGEGVTHLARKASKIYLNSHDLNNLNLTKEHKIYIEDYIKDKIGSKTLKTDETIEFSEDLIKEAIDSSTKLTAKQLKVIEQFSRLVVSEL